MTNDKEVLLEKIRKLMALAKGNTTEDEAASAMGKVQELLAKYDLRMADVTMRLTTEKVEGVTQQVFQDQRSRWKIALWQTSAVLNRCEYMTVGDRRTFSHMLLGKPHQVAVAKAMVEYLEASVRRLSKQAEATHKRSPNDGFRKSFRIGCAARLYVRASRLVEERSKAAWNATTGERLPALLGLHEQAKLEIAKYLADQGIRTKMNKIRGSVRNSEAYAAGSRAAEGISLDKQIQGRKMELLS